MRNKRNLDFNWTVEKFQGEFSSSKMDKFREATKDNIELIFYGNENIYDDYYTG